MRKFIEQLKIYFNLLLLNRRSTILSFLGLGLSLILIAQGLIFTYSFQYGAFEEYTGETPTRQVSIITSILEFSEEQSDIIDNLHNVSQQSIESLKLNSRIRKVDWHFEKAHAIGVKANNGKFQLIREFNLFGMSFDYFSTLQKLLFNGTLPASSSEVIVVTKSSTISNSNLGNTGEFPLYVPTWGGYIYEKPINVSGIIEREDLDAYEGSFRDDFQSMLDYFTDEFMIINNVNFPTENVRAIGRFSFYLNEINSFNIKQEISMVNGLCQELSRELKEEGYEHLFVYNELGEILKSFSDEFRLFQLFGLLFLAPLTAVTIALSSFSANQLKRRQKHHIALLYQRGSSSLQNSFF